MRAAALIAIGIFLCAPAAAQVRPVPGTGNPRLQSVDYDPQQIVQLEGSPGYQLTVELSPDEQVQNVALGDGGAWQVSINQKGDHLFIKPVAPVPTNMTVITSVRVYHFELAPAAGAEAPWHVRFRYPDVTEAPPSADSEYVDVSPLKRASSRYRVGGDRTLRPDSVTDDGEHTYISWARDKAIPAVYSISQSGEETLANGGMRDDVYVVDGVPGKLLFRIDGRTAQAVRLPPRKKR